MKEKYENLFNSLSDQMIKLNKKQIKPEEAKAFAALAKQANNILALQMDTAKFLNTHGEKSIKSLTDVGLM